ncbi:sigma-70 family RNA polymerase sigma factor [Duganella sp. FT135W]|uniref:Sigma-70 family RNA polymerase sigma factor n=1 Tax=Duganella flavida TaxID=2692175 RepID=A0A6L8KGF6_9BURK|nr:sigma-70 family RNA polymerase sigma factor [Duganella flavida]MYM25807.1 sigma-70 family RNA polymerase sigma factor [Duganella flavida]
MPIDTDTAIFEQLRPRLKAISSRIVGNDAEAEDIVQDCFLKWRNVEQAALETPAAWLTTVVQHHSIDRLRKRARDATAAHTAMELTPDATTVQPEDALLLRAEMGDALVRMLACLSTSERLALVLHEVFECEHADIAATLGINAANARQHLARARRRLREAADEPPASEKLNRELVQRFHAAIHGIDAPAIITLLGDGQPLSVQTRACANDASYALAA